MLSGKMKKLLVSYCYNKIEGENNFYLWVLWRIYSCKVTEKMKMDNRDHDV